jgi:glutathione S-transferase
MNTDAQQHALSKPSQPIKVYGMDISGHCHRVELFCSLLGLPWEHVNVDLRQGAHKTPEFLCKNPFGQVPVIEDGDLCLADSNAILVYLESRYAPGQWMPRDPIGAAQVMRWLMVAAGPLAFGASAARAIVLFKRADDPTLPMTRANNLLRVMDEELATRPFLAGDKPTLADVANYSYTAHAPEGNVSLEPYPNVRAWLARVEALPGFMPMVKSPVGLCA